ncbi:hypothetical protein MiSe_26000 [Microseira wollei NIES-4236]|uniref:Uncharacterized protein n=1 Tax=Microseira wollei NIES-4236 TaxID=2530354 RepID=A0AAV3X969_9CYAN|nr:hypothetical protein [Microseira wollei]GET37846.1 hypothetical protein MiSe_26000 [Microseira wollei NIES-4236]
MSIDPNDIDPQSISSASDSEYRQSPGSDAVPVGRGTEVPTTNGGFALALREEALQRLRNRLRLGK